LANQALSGLSTLFNWGSICMCHIRFRKAWRVQGHSVDELLGFILVCLVLIAQFYTAVCKSSFLAHLHLSSPYSHRRCAGPIGGAPSDPGEAAETFFLAYLVSQMFDLHARLTAVQLLTGLAEQAAPIVIALYIIAFSILRTFPKKAHEIDLDVSLFLDTETFY
jgi:amino acid transporter